MGSLIVVRHGQASIHEANYDQLSQLGRVQSRRLGDYWAARGQVWNQVLLGPLRRHRETLDEFTAAYGARGIALPEPTLIEGMREHEAIRVIDHVLGQQGRDKPAGTNGADRLAFFRDFDRVMRAWVAEELELPPEWESWQQARARAESALRDIISGADGQLIAFTSGGFLSMAVGVVLGLDDETVYELSLEVTNSAWAEFRLTDGRLRLKHFNWHPHLEPADVTLV